MASARSSLRFLLNIFDVGFERLLACRVCRNWFPDVDLLEVVRRCIYIFYYVTGIILNSAICLGVNWPIFEYVGHSNLRAISLEVTRNGAIMKISSSLKKESWRLYITNRKEINMCDGEEEMSISQNITLVKRILEETTCLLSSSQISTLIIYCWHYVAKV